MSTAIEFDHVGKQYRLGLVSTKTLSHDLNRWWQTAVLKKEDPYLRIGETNDRTIAGNSDYVWALKDIDFKIEQGDVVGIIGKNGAGKSTLLKLLSKVTGPTVGTIRARGRIGALLEVGTGFHSEMTGRENIYMNGAIMGMSRYEISQKLDEIIAFSGCERYIDTPVKRYSSGMTVRLGFAVAAHLDPDILVVDEVLAVGDAEFQKKAIGKMKDVSHQDGRTVLFVSHNMTAVKSLCKNGIILQNGMMVDSGDVETVVSHYLRGNSDYDNCKVWPTPIIKAKGFEVLEMGVCRSGGQYKDPIRMNDAIEVRLKYRLVIPHNEMHITYHFKNEQGQKIFSCSGGGRCYPKKHDAGTYEQVCYIPADFLNWGVYSVDLFAVENSRSPFLLENDIVSFVVSNKGISLGSYMGKEPGDVTPKFDFIETKLE